MKKLLIVLLSICLIVGLYSCGTNDAADDTVYNVKTNHSYDGEIEYERFSLELTEYHNQMTPNNRELYLNDCIIMLNYSYSIFSPWRLDVADYYCDETNGLIVGFSSITNRLLSIITDATDRCAITYNGEQFTEAIYLEWLEDIIIDLFGIDLSMYKYSCETNIDGKSLEGFIVQSDSENDQDYLYIIEYVNYVQGIKTSDKIRITFRGDGGISSIICSEFLIDNNSSVTVDNEKIIRTIEKVANNICDGKLITEIEIHDKMLISCEGKPYVLCFLSIGTKESLFANETHIDDIFAIDVSS